MSVSSRHDRQFVRRFPFVGFQRRPGSVRRLRWRRFDLYCNAFCQNGSGKNDQDDQLAYASESLDNSLFAQADFQIRNMFAIQILNI